MKRTQDSRFPIRLGKRYDADLVTRIQYGLILHGCMSGPATGNYDLATFLGVKIFQVRFAHPAGFELPITGEVDILTMEAILNESILSANFKTTALHNSLLDIARGELGNDDPKRYFIFSDSCLDIPWSVVFARFCFFTCCTSMGASCVFPEVSTAQALWNACKDAGSAFRTESIVDGSVSLKPGAIAVNVIRGEEYGQVGIVEAIRGPSILTIEGCTRGKGTSRTLHVSRRIRNLSAVDPGFVTVNL